MDKAKIRKLIKYFIIIFSLPLLIFWDISNTSNEQFNYKSFANTSGSKANLATGTTVALVRSDDTTLANPSPITSNPSTQTIEQMVRRAISLAGGFPLIQTGMKVLIKPNLVESDQPSGSGTNTDVRVVEAVVKYIDEIDHGNIKIMVGDGSPRPYTTFEKSVSIGKTPWGQLYGNADTTKDAGYQKLKTRMLSLGIDFRLTNLNGNSDTNPWDELREYNIAGGGVAQPQNGNYHIHPDVLDADVYITVSVMKIHDPGITCALKNQIGLAPSSLYGFPKTNGVSATGILQSTPYAHKLLHTAQAPYNWTDKEIVDLSTIAKIKYAVIDALMCLEKVKTTQSDKSNQVRMNMIIAGSDPVATDHVCARLMGLNPDDIEHITLAERVGLGTNDPSKISIVGASLASSLKRFKKNTAISDQIFGQSNRNWILSNSFPINSINDPINYEFIQQESSLSPLPGINGWSESTYFINDRINLKDYYMSKSMGYQNVVGYAFTYFYAPADQEAELWVGSDEALKVYLNGSVVYNFNSTRTFSNTTIYIEPTTRINIKKGMNRLLVKVLQKTTGSYFDFSLNICSVESDVNYRGSRVWGLKFITDPDMSPVKTLNLTALIEGIYDGNSAIPDTVSAELHSSNYPYSLVESKKGVLNNSGSGSFDFINAASGTPYYIAVKHRNAIETWGSNSQIFSGGVLSYDFTINKTQAYGSNMKLKGTKWCIYSGDVNQDGQVSFSDLIAVDNGAANFVTGYTVTDLTGDGQVTFSDLIIVDNNNTSFITKVVPTGSPTTKRVNRSAKVKSFHKRQ